MLEWLNKLEKDMFRWFKPRWWQLRRAIQSGYDFSKHSIQPPWRQVLQNLQTEHDAVTRQGQHEKELTKRFGLTGSFETWYEQLTQLRSQLVDWQEAAGHWLKQLVARDDHFSSSTIWSWRLSTIK